MASVPPPEAPVGPGEPGEPGQPSDRWPLVALAAGLLIIVVAGAFYFLNRPRGANITVEGTPTGNPVAAVGSPSAGPTPTLVPPTPTASATPAPTATPLPAPTATPGPPPPTPPPPATQLPATQPPATQPPAAAAPPTTQPPTAAPPLATQPAVTTGPTPAATPATPRAMPATPPATPVTPVTPAVSPLTAGPSPTSFTGQVANAGGLGNTRSDFDAAYGAVVGETPGHLVIYRMNNIEYHVSYVPDPNGRAALIVELPQQNQQPWPLDQATTEAHKLLPNDAQPPNPQPEGNDQYMVERYTSQTLAQPLPADVFTANKGQPGQFLIVYVKDTSQPGRLNRIIIGPGNDPQALITQGR